MVGQPRRNSAKMVSWSRVSEHLVNIIGMSDQLKWNNHYKIRANMRQILEDLNFYFYRINRSYIINLNEIKQIKNGRVILKNDMEVSLQRGQIKKFQNTYDNFLCRKIIL